MIEEEGEVWECDNCGIIKDKEEEVRCWECGKGEMIYKGNFPCPAKFKKRGFFSNLLHKFRIKRGWIYCPICKEFMKPKWIKDWVYDPEEPPMFGHYICPKCKATTEISPTILTNNVVKKMGYESFDDFINKRIDKNE